ncbi:hypothetical protein VUR80DRAFT_9443 [Thermomyces stellatus]
MTDIQDKDGRAIRRGDQVYTPIRGGKHEGMVDKIVTSENDAAEEGVKRPPKVLYTNQRGKAVAHNPATLQHVEKQEEGEKEEAGMRQDSCKA